MPLLPAAGAIGLWFQAAPDPRFLGIIPWIIPAWIVVWISRSLSEEHFRAFQAVTLPVVAITSGMFFVAAESPTFSGTYDRLGLATVPKAKLEVHTTHSGLKVRLPVDRSDRRTWYAKLPTAPRLNPKLELRRRKMKDGFRVAQNSNGTQSEELGALHVSER
jgi:hypothetical protein